MLLIRDAEVDGRRVDVRIADGVVAAIGVGLDAGAGDELVDAAGGALIPGLHDHHIHLLALVAALDSVLVGPPAVRDALGLAAVLRSVPDSPAAGWIRAVGYHESVAGALDRWALDAVVAERPVRVQHRSGALWILNSAALVAVGLDGPDGPDGVERDGGGRPTGRLWRLDGWLRGRLPAPPPPELAAVSEQLLRHGVTGVTDATPTEEPEAMELLAAAVRRGGLAQRVVVTGGPGLTAAPSRDLDVGPVKLLFADHEPPSLDAMIDGIRAARAQHRAVAVHAVTAVAAALTVAAIEEVGPAEGDRIEHGAVLSLGLAERIAALGITVVTNPGFVASRGDQYLDDVAPDELPDLWRCASLIDAGVSLAAGTDAPFGDANPWAAIAAAVARTTHDGVALGRDERIAARRALDLFLGAADRPGGEPRELRVGSRADLCLLPAPLDDVLTDPAAVRPAATVVRGRLHRG